MAGFYYMSRERSRFGGRWRAIIRWTPEWAESHLTGYICHDAHSQGEIALSYGSGPKKDQYWGLGVWQLREGTDELANLCVELHGFVLARDWSSWSRILRHSLKTCVLTSRFRHEIGGFAYSKKFANYEINFSQSTQERLLGSVQVRTGNFTTAVVVGAFDAERVA
jgi:hypothetical protein